MPDAEAATRAALLWAALAALLSCALMMWWGAGAVPPPSADAPLRRALRTAGATCIALPLSWAAPRDASAAVFNAVVAAAWILSGAMCLLTTAPAQRSVAEDARCAFCVAVACLATLAARLLDTPDPPDPPALAACSVAAWACWACLTLHATRRGNSQFAAPLSLVTSAMSFFAFLMATALPRLLCAAAASLVVLWGAPRGGPPGFAPAPKTPAQLTATAVSAPNDRECPVCLQPNADAQTPCGHVGHRGCLARWAAVNPSCPVCRACIATAEP